jgi:hypothetical protein
MPAEYTCCCMVEDEGCVSDTWILNDTRQTRVSSIQPEDLGFES